MKTKILGLVFLLLITGCSYKKDLIREKGLVKVFEDKYRFTGVAISKNGRFFLNYPNWDKNYRYAVVEILKNGSKIPFPNEEWNTESNFPKDYFVCVQSIHVDENDDLWILDAANPWFQGVIKDGAKLIKIDLHSNKVEKKILFDEKLLSKNTYLNDLRIDTSKNKAYITDSGTGGIFVVDLETGKQRKLLEYHFSTMAEPDYMIKINGKELQNKDGLTPEIHSDGIAFDKHNMLLYYHALTGTSLYKIPTDILTDKNLLLEEDYEEYVEKVCETGAIDGLAVDKNGVVFLSALEENAINYVIPEGEIKTLIADEIISWPDSLSISNDDYLYFTTSRIHKMEIFNLKDNAEQIQIEEKSEDKYPYKVFKIDIRDIPLEPTGEKESTAIEENNEHEE